MKGYEWAWGVYRWLPGKSGLDVSIADSTEAGESLGSFVSALQQIDVTGGPPGGPGNFYRGVPLAVRDAGVRRAIEALRPDELDVHAFESAWEDALAAAEWSGDDVWIHGDIAPGNLLINEGGLSAVIDFGCLGTGDPAWDLMPAWTVFDQPARGAFRAAVDADEATWARAKGCALTWVGALPYYRETNQTIVATARRTIARVMEDRG